MKNKIMLATIMVVLLALSGCASVTTELQPHRDMTISGTVTASSDYPIVMGTIKDSLYDTYGNCEEGEDSVVCYIEGMLEEETNLWTNAQYITDKGFFKSSYRISLSSAGEEEDSDYGKPSEMGMVNDLIIYPFGSVIETNCVKLQDEKAYKCDLNKEQDYYIEWNEWSIIGWFKK